jgi:hypothetical protein
MIYSRFGTKLTPLSKEQDAAGHLSIHATAEDADGTRRYVITDLKADDGMPEINDLLTRLPWKVLEKKEPRRRRHLP